MTTILNTFEVSNENKKVPWKNAFLTSDIFVYILKSVSYVFD